MEERTKRRKMIKDIYILNKNGWFTRNGITYLAIDYIKEKLRENLSDPEKLSKFLTKVKSSKIIVGNKSDRDSAISLLESYGLKPTVNKFILLKDD